MDPNIIYIIIGVSALIIGIIAGKFIFEKDTRKQIEKAEIQSQAIIKEAGIRAETIRKEKELEAKEKFVQMKAEHDKEVLERNRKLGEGENRIRQKEQSINQKENNLDKQIKENELEKIAGLTGEEAKTQLVESLRQEAQTQALGIQQDIIDDAKQKANKEARKIIIQTIQRTAAEQAIENAITVFNLESDEIKGQIIGREGRNIRAIEAATGVDLIVDDTPEAIILSSFDPLRREIARLSLQRLVTDGRIHPPRSHRRAAAERRAAASDAAG